MVKFIGLLVGWLFGWLLVRRVCGVCVCVCVGGQTA